LHAWISLSGVFPQLLLANKTPQQIVSKMYLFTLAVAERLILNRNPPFGEGHPIWVVRRDGLLHPQKPIDHAISCGQGRNLTKARF